MQEIPDFADDFAGLEEDLLDLWISHEIEVSLAVAYFGVGQPVPFFGGRTKRLRQNDKRGQPDRDFTCFGREQRAVRADEVTQVEVAENVELLVTEDVFLGINLQTPGLAADIYEH